MKNSYFIIISLCICAIANAQTINFPDANFKAKLLSTNIGINDAIDLYGNSIKIDSNNNGEIEVSEAMMVLEINVINTNIGSLIGISSFSNVHRLWCDNNYLQELSLVGLSQISDLGFSNNQLTNIDLSELNLLRSLYCNNNQLSTPTLLSNP